MHIIMAYTLRPVIDEDLIVFPDWLDRGQPVSARLARLAADESFLPGDTESAKSMSLLALAVLMLTLPAKTRQKEEQALRQSSWGELLDALGGVRERAEQELSRQLNSMPATGLDYALKDISFVCPQLRQRPVLYYDERGPGSGKTPVVTAAVSWLRRLRVQWREDISGPPNDVVFMGFDIREGLRRLALESGLNTVTDSTSRPLPLSLWSDPRQPLIELNDLLRYGDEQGDDGAKIWGKLCRLIERGILSDGEQRQWRETFAGYTEPHRSLEHDSILSLVLGQGLLPERVELDDKYDD